MDKDNFFVKTQIRSDIEDVNKLLGTGVFNSPVLRPFHEPVFVSIVFKLGDLLQKFRILKHRINFKDDIVSGDITDLVNKIGNAIRHLNSGENLLDKKRQIKFVFNMVVGKGNAVMIGNNIVAKSDYVDDIAFFYGDHRIYLKRHILRALKDSIGVASELYPNDFI